MEECQRIFIFLNKKMSNILVGIFCMHCVFYMSCFYQHFVCQFREGMSVDCGYRNCFFWEVGCDVDQEKETLILIIFISVN
jgi:hypothetical protein